MPRRPPPDRRGGLSSPVPGEVGSSRDFVHAEVRHAVETAPSHRLRGEGWGGGPPRHGRLPVEPRSVLPRRISTGESGGPPPGDRRFHRRSIQISRSNPDLPIQIDPDFDRSRSRSPDPYPSGSSASASFSST